MITEININEKRCLCLYNLHKAIENIPNSFSGVYFLLNIITYIL